MTPTRRKPTKRKVTDKSIGTPADALSVDELRPDGRTADGQGAFGVGETPAPAPAASPRGRGGESAAPEKYGAQDAPVSVPRNAGAREAAEGAFCGHADGKAGRAAAREHGEAGGPHAREHGEWGEGGEGAASEGGEEAAREARRRFLGPLQITLIVILAVLLVIEGGFCLMRWGVDDAADVQGTWYVNGSNETIVITAESIVLADDVAYGYALDEGAKTIAYEFGIMEGQGRYRFSLDREQLAIIDGEFTFMDTFMADISWTFEALVAQLSGEPLAPGSGDGAMLLARAEAQPSPGAQPDGEGAAGESEGALVNPDGAAGEGGGEGDAADGSVDAEADGSGDVADDPAADGADGPAADAAKPTGNVDPFYLDVSDIPMISGGGHPLPAPEI